MDNELLRLILFLAAIGVVNDPQQLQTRMPNHVYVAVRPAGGCQRIQGTVQGQQWFVLSDGIADAVFDNSVDCALVPAASLPPAHRKRPPGARAPTAAKDSGGRVPVYRSGMAKSKSIVGSTKNPLQFRGVPYRGSRTARNCNGQARL